MLNDEQQENVSPILEEPNQSDSVKELDKGHDPRQSQEEEPQIKPKNGVVQPPFKPTIDRPGRLTNQLIFLKPEVAALWKHDYAWPFQHPVNSIKLGIPDYYKTIKRPMDIGTIKKRLEHNYYWSAQECLQDFETMFSNCYTFNYKGDSIYLLGQAMEKEYRKIITIMPKDEVEVETSPVKVGAGRKRKEAPDPEISPHTYKPRRMRTRSRGNAEDTSSQTLIENVQENVEISPIEPSVMDIEDCGMKVEKCEATIFEMSHDEKYTLVQYLNEVPLEDYLRILDILQSRQPSLIRECPNTENRRIAIEAVEPTTLQELDLYIHSFKEKLALRDQAIRNESLQDLGDVSDGSEVSTSSEEEGELKSDSESSDYSSSQSSPSSTLSSEDRK